MKTIVRPNFAYLLNYCKRLQNISNTTSILLQGQKLAKGCIFYKKHAHSFCFNFEISCVEYAPKIFSFLPNYDKITKPLKDNYDLVIVTDCATLDRVGQEEHYFENAKYTVNIDHHISNTNYANYNFVLGNSPACCEYLYNIYK